MLYERGNFDVGSYAGKRFLSGLTLLIPDNKSTEDTGNYLRDLGRHNRNFISSRIARMAAAVNSERLESRGLSHQRVTKTISKAEFNQKHYDRQASVFDSLPLAD